MPEHVLHLETAFDQWVKAYNFCHIQDSLADQFIFLQLSAYTKSCIATAWECPHNMFHKCILLLFFQIVSGTIVIIFIVAIFLLHLIIYVNGTSDIITTVVVAVNIALIVTTNNIAIIIIDHLM